MIDGFSTKNEILPKVLSGTARTSMGSSYKYMYNLKKKVDSQINYFYERLDIGLDSYFLYSCRFKSSKNVLLLRRRHKGRQRLVDTLFDSVFYSGLNLAKLFFTSSFRKDNLVLHRQLFKDLFEKTKTLPYDKQYTFRTLLSILLYIRRCRKKSKKITLYLNKRLKRCLS